MWQVGVSLPSQIGLTESNSIKKFCSSFVQTSYSMKVWWLPLKLSCPY